MPDYRWGIFLRRGRADRTIRFGDDMGEPAWQRCRASSATMLRRLVVTQGDTEPAQRRAAAPASADGAVALRPAQPVPGQRRGGPPPAGRWSTCCTATSAATAARRPRRCCSAARRRRTSRASWAPSTSRRTNWLAFFMFTYFTDRDGKYPAARAGRERLRSAGAHDAVHADRGGAPHVRRRDRRAARRAAHLRADERAWRPEDERRRAPQGVHRPAARSSAT